MKIKIDATVTVDESSITEEVLSEVKEVLRYHGIFDIHDDLERFFEEFRVKIKEPKIENIIDIKTDKPKRKYTKHIKSVEQEIKPISEGNTKPIILKTGERYCENKDCKKPFRPEKFGQRFCSLKCEAKSLGIKKEKPQIDPEF